MHRGKYDLLIVTSIIIASFIIHFYFMNQYPVPSGDDPAMYILMGRYYLTGDSSLLFGEPVSYLPLVPVLAYLIAPQGLKILGALLPALLSLPAYLIAKAISKDRYSPILSALLSSFGIFFMIYESMVAWGMYASLAALFFIGMVFYFYLSIIKDETNRNNYIYLIFFSLLSSLSHYYSIVAYAILLLYTIIILAFLSFKIKKAIFPFLIAIAPAFVMLPFIIGSINQTVPNPALIVESHLNIIDQISKAISGHSAGEIIFSLALIALAFFGMLYIRSLKIIIFFILWLIVPLLFTQIHSIGITTFYWRFIQLTIMPLHILSGLGIASILLRFNKRIVNSMILILVFSLVFLIGTGNLIARLDNDAKIRGAEYDAILWIKENTPQNVTIASSYPLAHWISAISERRVLAAHPLNTIAVRGQIQRSVDCYALLLSSYCAQNGLVRIYEMEPNGFVHAPMISPRFMGSYLDAILINDGYSYVNGVPLSSVFKKGNWSISNNSYHLSIIGESISKDIFLEHNSTIVKIQYSMKSESKLIIVFYIYPEYEAQTQEIQLINGSVQFVSKNMPGRIEYGAGNVTIDFDVTWKLTRITIIYENITNASILVNIKPDKDYIAEPIYATSHTELINQYNVSYIAIWKKGPEAVSLEMFNHLYKLVYENDAVVIYKVN